METPPTHAGGVVVRPGTDGWDVLLVRPSSGADEWVLPKGHIERGETPEIAAVREVREEAGVEAEVLAYLELVEYPVRSESTRVAFFLMRRRGDVAAAEGRGIRWSPLADAPSVATYAEQQRLLRGTIVHPLLRTRS